MIDIQAYASGSAGNCYTVDNGCEVLMLDCGLPFRDIHKRLNYKLPNAVLITHEHMDHAKGVADMARIGIDCYMTGGTARQLGITGHRVHIIKARQKISFGSYEISAFETQHDAAEPIGFVIEDSDDKLLYATDTFYIRYRFAGLTKIMIECNHSYDILDQNISKGLLNQHLRDRLVKSHFSLENLKEFLLSNDLSKVNEIYLVHLSDLNADEKLFKKEIAALTGRPVYVV